MMFLIGDFTGLIGRPRQERMPPGPICRVKANPQVQRTYQNRYSRFWIGQDRNLLQLRNGWMAWVPAEGMNPPQLSKLWQECSERDDFAKRYVVAANRDSGFSIRFARGRFPLR